MMDVFLTHQFTILLLTQIIPLLTETQMTSQHVQTSKPQ